MSAEIELIKTQGQVNGLKASIRSLINELSHRNFEGIEEKGQYKSLGKAVDEGMDILHKIKDRLAAIHEIDGKSK